jgi:hypothetical protein
MSKRSWMSRVARLIAWLALGGAVLQTSCSLTLQDAIVSAFAQFVSNYVAAILERFVPTA